MTLCNFCTSNIEVALKIIIKVKLFIVMPYCSLAEKKIILIVSENVPSRWYLLKTVADYTFILFHPIRVMVLVTRLSLD